MNATQRFKRDKAAWVARCLNQPPIKPAIKQRQLKNSAPELLAMLQELIMWHDAGTENGAVWIKARAEVAKATA